MTPPTTGGVAGAAPVPAGRAGADQRTSRNPANDCATWSLLVEGGPRYNGEATCPGAQTERRGGAGPAGACLAVRTPPAALSGVIRQLGFFLLLHPVA